MASTVKIITKPQVIHPGKERQAEHARQLVQHGLNRGMRLQETKIVPLAPDDKVGKEEPVQPKQEPQKTVQTAQKPPQKKPQKKQTAAEVAETEEQVVENSLLTASQPVVIKAVATGFLAGDKYKHEDKAVTVVGIFGTLILLAETNLLKKGTEVFAIDCETFKKKFEKV